jgi:hypothetical protein
MKILFNCISDGCRGFEFGYQKEIRESNFAFS